jgi:hypothetical protein
MVGLWRRRRRRRLGEENIYNDKCCYTDARTKPAVTIKQESTLDFTCSTVLPKLKYLKGVKNNYWTNKYEMKKRDDRWECGDWKEVFLGYFLKNMANNKLNNWFNDPSAALTIPLL